MKDNYGNELNVGDRVAYIYTFCRKNTRLFIGKIEKIEHRFGEDLATIVYEKNPNCLSERETKFFGLNKKMTGCKIIKL